MVRPPRALRRAAFGALLLLGLAAPAFAAAPFVGFDGDGPWQARVWFAGPADLQLLGERFDHFAREASTGAILVFVADRADLDWLAARGLWVELDAERTGWIVDGRRAAAAVDAPLSGIPGYPCYRTVEETFAAAQAIVDAHPGLAAWVDVGNSWQKTVSPGSGYDLKVLVLTNHAIAGPKPKLFVTAAIHAREYTTAESATRFAEQLVAGYGTDADATWLLDWHEIHLLLQTNPDGRKQAETGLFWRKNTDDNFCSGTSSRGIDLNRNFSFEWACCPPWASSNLPCDDTYHGPAPASEPEVQAVQSYLRAQYADLRGDDPDEPAADDTPGVYLDLHSFGQWVITPFTYRVPGEGSPNLDEFTRFAHRLAWYSGYEPLVGGPYQADGTTSDFGYGDLGVASIAFEMGTAFFQSCTSFENSVLPGALSMLRYVAKVARAPYLLPGGPDAVDLALSATPVPAGYPIRLTARIDDTRTSTSGGLLPSQNIFSAKAWPAPWAAGAVAIPLAPVDGALNSPNESVQAHLESGAIPAGRHLLFVQGRDVDGDDGPVSAIFLDVTASTVLFADDFETGGTGRWSATGH